MQNLRQRAGGAKAVCAVLAFPAVCMPVLGQAQQVNGPVTGTAAAGPLSSTSPFSGTLNNAAAAISASNPQSGPAVSRPAGGPANAVPAATNPAANSPAINSPAVGSPSSNTMVGQALTQLRDGAPAQQGVPVPRSVGGISRRVSLQANTGVTYDSNALRANQRRVATVTDLSKDDLTIPVGVDVDLLIPTGPNVFSLQGRVGYNFYLRNSNRNSEEIGLTGSYQRQIGRCGAGLSAAISRSRTRFNEFGFLDRSNNLQTTESGGVSLSCSLTASWRPFGSFDYIHATNSSVVRSYSDHDTKSFGGGIVYLAPALGEIGAVASIEDTSYPNRRPGLFNFGATSLRVKSIGGTFNRMTARILQASVQINYTSVDDGQPNGSYSGLSGNVLVRYAPGGRFVFSLVGSRTASPSLSLVSDYDLVTQLSFDIGARINSRASARLGFGRIHRKLFGVVALPGIPLNQILTNDDNTSIDAGFNYFLNRRISLFASLVHEKRSANNVIYNYSGTRATLGVNFKVF